VAELRRHEVVGGVEEDERTATVADPPGDPVDPGRPERRIRSSVGLPDEPDDRLVRGRDGPDREAGLLLPRVDLLRRLPRPGEDRPAVEDDPVGAGEV
jgi:hypothetical protein